jgi:uncharacterized membrane protein HdeD (DUF308 family)
MTPLQISWGLYVSLGLLFLLLGVIGLSMVYVLTDLCVFIAGYLLIIGGVAQIVSGVFTRPIGSALLQFIAGVLYLLAGGFVLSNPLLAEVIYTFIIAISLIINGAVRIVLALIYRRFLSWMVIVLGGVLTMVVGVYILNRWPWDSAWVIGLFFAIDLMTQGITWIIHGVNMRLATTCGSPLIVKPTQ